METVTYYKMKHKDLDKKLLSESKNHNPDQAVISDIKKQKLYFKDCIDELERKND